MSADRKMSLDDPGIMVLLDFNGFIVHCSQYTCTDVTTLASFLSTL